MQADIKLLPCSQIWFCAAPNKYYRGVLDSLSDNGEAIIILFANREFGDQWMLEEIPYGKHKLKHWFFHNISDATLTIMENIGRPLVGDEIYPAHYVKQPEQKQEELNEQAFVEAAVAAALAQSPENIEDTNGADHTIKADRSAAKSGHTKRH